jgi:DNA repair exonuclease SbcCD ATPase subunit
LIKLKTLELAGFRSFKDFTQVTFPESGLTLIQGINEDTGDSSGSGKSSLVLAIQYLLGGCPFAGTDLKTWGEESAPVVKAVFETKSGLLEIERSKGLSVRLNGKKLGGSAALAEKELCQIFGMDSTSRSIVTYRGQKKPGFFLSMSDGEKKEFLSGLLSLDKFEKASETASVECKKYEAEKILLVDRFSTLSKTARDWENSMGMDPSNPEQIEFLKTKKQGILGTIHVLENENLEKYQWVNAKNKQYAELVDTELEGIKLERKNLLQNRLTPEVVELDAKIANLTKKIQAGQIYEAKEQSQHTAALTELQNKLRFLRREKERLPFLIKRKDQLESQLAAMAKNTCPTCQRDWQDGKNSTAQKDMHLELNTVQFDLDNLHNQQKQIDAIESQISEYPAFTPNPMLQKLVSTYEDVRKERSALAASTDNKLKVTLAELDNSERKVRVKYTQENEEAVSSIQPIIEENKNKINQLKKECIQIDQEIFTIETGTRSWQKQHLQLIEKQNEVFAAEQALNKVNTLLKLEQDFAHMVGNEGFLGAIFEEVLVDISQTANSIMQRISNVQHVSIRFSSEKETKAGKVSKRITPIVSIGGQEVKPEAGLSGGMYTAVELAVDLAVGDVVSRRKGAYPGWLILDESFEGLGKTSKETCLEMLTDFAKDRLILVVDHATELQSCFSQTIRVKLLDGKSSIVHD